jgi:hypothetical protein
VLGVFASRGWGFWGVGFVLWGVCGGAPVGVVGLVGLWGGVFVCCWVCVTGFGVEVSLGSSRPLSVRFDCGFERPRLILPRVAVCLDAGADALLTGERRGQGDASFGGLVFEC